MALAIRWRLTISIALAFIITIAAMFVALRLAVTEILDSDVDQNLSDHVAEVRGRVLVRGSQPGELPVVVAQFPFPVAVLDSEGVVIASNSEADTGAMALSAEEADRITEGGETVEKSVDIGGDRFLVRSLPRGNDVAGIIQVGRNTQAVENVKTTLTTILIGGGAIALLVVLVAAYWLAYNALRPIDQMTQLAADIQASDLTRRINVKRQPAEVQRLADTFDAMLGRLESAFGQQRNFVMDVSHELRTPLTGLRGNLDIMLMKPGVDAESRADLERMSAEVSRLIRLSQNLLYLAHAEAGREIVRLPVELDSLCLEVIHQERNVRGDVTLRLGHEEQVTISGDRDLLKQLVLNLVDNALKFARQNGEVSVSLFRGAGNVEIVVEDNGPGIPPEQIELIFERFYRGDNGGSRTVGGAGIGLAISRWIAQAHGGDIRAESEVGRGSRFIVTLPLAAEAVPAATG